MQVTRILIDTHVFLWWLENHPMEKEAADLIRDPQNIVLVSAASLWEIVIKKSIGKLKVKGNLSEEIVKNGFENLPIVASHALELEKLPALHRDPFDRMLIAQARCEHLSLVTHDSKISEYEVPVVLA